MRVALACEHSYTDIGRTVFVIQLAGKGNYMSSGASRSPTHAEVIGWLCWAGWLGCRRVCWSAGSFSWCDVPVIVELQLQKALAGKVKSKPQVIR